MATWQITRRDGLLELAGELRIADAGAIWNTLDRLTADPGPRLDLDLGQIAAIDGAIMALVVDVRRALAARGAHSEIVAAPSNIQPIVHLYRGDEPTPIVARPIHERAIARFGATVETALQGFRRLATFAGELVASVAMIVRRPAVAGWRAIPSLVTRAGTDGIPIVLLLDFLVGFVTAYQATRLLRIYGANIYIADMIGVSMTRELAPLMTAVIISGRSGAAFAAELGTMKVSDEIDALRTMGFAPTPYLVIPRIITLAIVAPVLTLLGDVIGVFGGLVVAVTSLDLTSHAYIAELRGILVPSDVWTGLVKSVAFGIAIAVIGCRHGLATRGDATGVGRGTTATVVSCLFAIVIIDTMFTVLFRGFGL